MKKDYEPTGIGYYEDEEGFKVPVTIENLKELNLNPNQISQVLRSISDSNPKSIRSEDRGNGKGSRKKGRPERSVGKR